MLNDVLSRSAAAARLAAESWKVQHSSNIEELRFLGYIRYFAPINTEKISVGAAENQITLYTPVDA